MPRAKPQSLLDFEKEEAAAARKAARDYARRLGLPVDDEDVLSELWKARP